MSLNYLADTHILLWAFTDPSKLSADIQAILSDDKTEVFYSPVNLWEIAIKYGLGKLEIKGSTPEGFLVELESSFFTYRPFDRQALVSSYQLPTHHKDPFDRLLIWEAIRGDLVLLSADSRSDAYVPAGLKVVH
ncbi:MAG: type II toxin-antitoxin system VapC family toxin [Coriobacteriales bacterium]|jgi:PIN domain nuclease of toxin-antitoxin system|nr:type II toxin-antitoxin system VapC family toxin [Coriobacteriales bacterium]